MLGFGRLGLGCLEVHFEPERLRSEAMFQMSTYPHGRNSDPGLWAETCKRHAVFGSLEFGSPWFRPVRLWTHGFTLGRKKGTSGLCIQALASTPVRV